MPTLANSIVSSSSRKLAIRVRPDLKARRQRYQGRVYWVVKEPVGLQYYRFEEEEFAILQMLDGQSSLEDIAEQFEAEFPPQTIRVEELQNFVGMLHRSGLVLTDASGQGVQLKQRRDERRRKEIIGAMSNILSFRFRGFDPERILNVMYPWVSWFFTVPTMIICIVLASCALTLVTVQFDVFQSRLPSFQSFFAAQNWLLIAGVLGVTKVIHEFGHGLSCKHFGGECHEMGVMFLVLTPCLYCNVSDSWMLPNRWHRAAIGAAGMYVEIVIASICTFIWWFSEPGFLNYVCLNVMFVSSVSTILFNANPLLRYDGYYILSDVMEIPNLRQKASSILSRKLGSWCLGSGRTRGSVSAETQSGPVRVVHRGVVLLPVGDSAIDSLLSQQGVRTVRAEGNRPDDRAGFVVGSGGDALTEGLQVFQSAWEDEQSEKGANVCDAAAIGGVRERCAADSLAVECVVRL